MNGNEGRRVTTDNFFADLDRAVSVLESHGYGSDMVTQVLGEHGMAAVNSRNYAAARWYACSPHGNSVDGQDVASAADSPTGGTPPVSDVRLAVVLGCYLREPLPQADWEAIFGAELTADLGNSGVILKGRLQADIRPISAPAHGPAEVLLVSDPDAAAEPQTPTAEHVPGAGNASMSLLNMIAPIDAGDIDPGSSQAEDDSSGVTEILDLGCGSGVLSLLLAASYPHVRVTGTDLSERALAFAELGRVSGNSGVDTKEKTDKANANRASNTEWLRGNWFDPVDGRQFDVIVSNPPFVMAPPAREEAKTYRESGLDLDGASALVVGEVSDYLHEGGRAHLLAGWALRGEESAAQRVSAWLPGHGVRAWVVQRELIDVAEYVTTWLRDEGVDVRTAEGAARVAEWLDYLARFDVTRIGMGYVHAEKLETEAPSEVTFEVMDQPLPAGTFLGHEVSEWFARARWLAEINHEELLDSTFAVRPGVAIERVEVADTDEGQGFTEFTMKLSRTDGPAWSHEIDAHVRAIISGLHPQGLALRDVIDLYCTVQGLDSDSISDALVPIVIDLIRHGFLLPPALMEEL